MNKKIFILIPVHNNLEYTKNCINSLFLQDYSNFKIVLIDDGSSDGTSDFVAKHYPSVKILNGDGTLWWTASINLGLNYALSVAATDDFILTLNNDLEVDSNYLSSLLEVYELYKPCLVGSTSVYIDNQDQIDFLGKKWNPYLAKTRMSINLNSYNELVKNFDVIETDLITGRGTLFPVAIAKQIGNYDDYHFPQYIADYDYGLRANKLGYKSIIASKAKVKSVVKNTGLNYKLRKVNYLEFLKSFFSIKSPIQLRARFYWAKLHSPIGILSFILDFLRIIVSFHRHLFLSRLNNYNDENFSK